MNYKVILGQGFGLKIFNAWVNTLNHLNQKYFLKFSSIKLLMAKNLAYFFTLCYATKLENQKNFNRGSKKYEIHVYRLKDEFYESEK